MCNLFNNFALPVTFFFIVTIVYLSSFQYPSFCLGFRLNFIIHPLFILRVRAFCLKKILKSKMILFLRMSRVLKKHFN